MEVQIRNPGTHDEQVGVFWHFWDRLTVVLASGRFGYTETHGIAPGTGQLAPGA